ncbi:class 1b ribonucleoside-diphosphate reductase subunit beta (plasmid) [Paenibacillus rhizovicinus]|uniref:ribonucleoside-diphosphate reductase n=1 Tax=Paenibacillus rhizovicinus TaxID=2704463 RepID=A0A6C0PCM7_9BACL|nr:class 1b ribonucleoside-diphosphate reductase subunit beta [Paenibacillus rhizovicinus]QHW35873.1 class 1b ribonucleoside-diphosphate reductase subunit beta [Paenibacillus rhizovicinus]
MIEHAVNWNRKIDHFTETFWEQNNRQNWIDTEFVPSDDIKVWKKMDKALQEAYAFALAGLTFLDTIQANVGMSQLAIHIKELKRKSVAGFMAMMEHMHAKSYSTIFTTLITDGSYIDWLLEDWVKNHPLLQKKARIIQKIYLRIKTDEDLWLAMVASVFLESYLFYSGFFLPLFLAGGGIDGQAMLTNSAEIINLILRDEAVHGSFIGLLAQELFESFDEDVQSRLKKTMYALLEELHEIEMAYTEEIYGELGLAYEVKAYVRYNANRAMQNLGFDDYFPEEHINVIVMNATSKIAEFITHDFFSQKGVYKKANVQPITKADFDRVNERLKLRRM